MNENNDNPTRIDENVGNPVYIVDTTVGKDGTWEVSVSPNTSSLKSIPTVDYTEEGIPIIGVASPEDLALIGGVPEGYTLEWFRPNTWPIQTRDTKFCTTSKTCVVIARQAKGTFKAPPDPTGLHGVTQDLVHQLKHFSPAVEREYYRPYEGDDDGMMLEISIPDLHYGLTVYKDFYASQDAGYSMLTAERLFMSSIEQFLYYSKRHSGKQGKRGLDYILFPIGNDYLHVDNHALTTTKGTFQPESVEWQRAFIGGRDLLIKGITRLAQVAPVKVISIPGNHDKYSTMHMSMIMEAYFHNDANVEVDASPSPIKYHRYGSNLIGFDHGRYVNPMKYSSLMADDVPADWAASKFRAWHLGDRHRKGGIWFSDIGVDIDYIPSLCGHNSWHRERAFVANRSAYAYLWSMHGGQLARFAVSVDRETGNLA